jgi:hypothetical protein
MLPGHTIVLKMTIFIGLWQDFLQIGEQDPLFLIIRAGVILDFL